MLETFLVVKDKRRTLGNKQTKPRVFASLCSDTLLLDDFLLDPKHSSEVVNLYQAAWRRVCSYKL
jgi:hypothetical protein